MYKLVVFTATLALVGCTAVPQDQVLKRLPIGAQAKAGEPVNWTTRYRLNGSYTSCN